MEVLFVCPICEHASRAKLDKAQDWQCSACDHRQHIDRPEATLPQCAVCGCHELYKQKDFPHRLGMAILLGGFAVSSLMYNWYEKWLCWAVLIGTAAFDAILFMMVGDAVVCYRCNAHHRGFKPTNDHKPYELTTGERYRQERIRQQNRLSPPR